MKWFKHESDASNDKKLIKLRKKFGFAGIGLYWTCLEEIAKGIDKSKLTFELEQDFESLAIMGGIEPEECALMMAYMLKIKLFEYSSVEESFFCFGLARRIENSIVKNPQFKQLQKDVKTLLLKKEQDLSGMIPDSSGKLGLELEIESELELDLSTTTAIAPPAFVDKSKSGEMTKIHKDWCPSDDCVEELKEHHLVEEWFIADYRVEFIQYWKERDIEHQTWNTLFFQQCSEQWEKRQR